MSQIDDMTDKALSLFTTGASRSDSNVLISLLCNELEECVAVSKKLNKTMSTDNKSGDGALVSEVRAS